MAEGTNELERMKVVVNARSQVYHKQGRLVPRASTNFDHVTPCGFLWYALDYRWQQIIVEAEAVVQKLRPCMGCYRDRYTTNERTVDRGFMRQTTHEELRWR